MERPLITMVKDKALIADYQAKVRALEEKDRDLYFDAVEKINGGFRQRVAEILLSAAAGGDARGARQMDQNQNTTPTPGRAGATPLPNQNMAPPNARAGRATQMQGGAIGDDKIGGAALQNARADDPVWGQWLRFRQLAPGDFATRGKALADEIARRKWNAIIARQSRRWPRTRS